MRESASILEPILRILAREVAEEVCKRLPMEDIIGMRRELVELRAELERFKASPKSLSQIPESGTCWTCLWFGGKICLRVSSPNYRKPVAATDTCELYKKTKLPRGELIKAVGLPDGRLDNKETVSRRPVTPKMVCPGCGHLVPVMKSGDLYRHDLEGKVFRGRGGDKSRPCVGASDDLS